MNSKMNNNNRMKDLRALQAADFVVDEIGLYLQAHPTNKNALNQFSRAVKEAKELRANFEKTYGPLTMDNAGGPVWNWIKSPWPWQNEREA
ncbi:MAG TPA: spore coat protein CotJB [Bacillota bacterium]|nr:spore coat protein CotJB [Bacillota bacterium]